MISVKKTFIYSVLRFLYGNYFKPRILKQRLSFRPMIKDAHRKHLKELRLNGFTLIPNFFSQSELDSFKVNVISELDKLDGNYTHEANEEIQYFDDKKKMIKKAYGYSRLFDLETLNPNLKKFFEHPDILQIASAYFGRKANYYHSTAQKSQPINKMGLDWHLDDYFPRFKALIYLHDVHMAEGPFSYLKGSHKLSLAKLKKVHQMYTVDYAEGSIYSDEEIKNLNFESVYITAKAGDLLLADVCGVHRGNPVEEGHKRYALFSFYSPDRRVNGHHKK